MRVRKRKRERERTHQSKINIGLRWKDKNLDYYFRLEIHSKLFVKRVLSHFLKLNPLLEAVIICEIVLDCKLLKRMRSNADYFRNN